MKITGETREAILNKYTMEDVAIMTEMLEYEQWADDQRKEKMKEEQEREEKRRKR